MRQNAFLASGLILALTLTIGSAYATYREVMPFVGGITTSDKISGILAGANTPGLSQRSKRVAMDDCTQVLLSVDFALLESPLKSRVVGQCRQAAQAVTAETPTDTYGWYMKALTSSLESDWDGLNAALVQSRHGTPNQEGYAYFRATLAFQHLQQLDAVTRAAVARDIAVVVTSPRGLTWAVGVYAGNPAERDFLTGAIEAAPTAAQQRFLRAVTATRG